MIDPAIFDRPWQRGRKKAVLTPRPMVGGLCVYAHYADGECFYIGIGLKDRAYTKRGRNEYWEARAAAGYEVVILADGLNRREALRIEAEMIERYSPACSMRKGRPGRSC